MKSAKYRFLIMFLFFIVLYFLSVRNTVKADASDTAILRIIATGDLHGQTTAYNFETNQVKPDKGLSKLATMATQKKKEVGENNTLLVDAGDFLYDYTSNFFYDNYKDLLQPVMRAMSIMGYDYITLGNHEFDYPWDYLQDQLVRSGLSDKVLLCNTVWHDSGKQVFRPSAIITKNLTTSAGALIPVKIGIIGATTNSISSRRGDYVNVIDTLDNYDFITAEADRLKKEEKADVVLVLLHGGIGAENPENGSDNIGYALTKNSSIDAVVAAHTHNIFPEEKEVKDLDIPLDKVDIKNGCINGKPVVEASSHAAALGTIDLTFEVTSDGKVKLSGGKSRIDYVKDTVKENSRISAMFSDYRNKLLAGSNKNTYSIAKEITYHNYDTVVRDNNLYQLLNNAKIEYGLTYITENLPEYKNVPVIACTRNLLDSNETYFSMSDTLSYEKISHFLSESSSARPSGYLQMFELSGKALREWLEYNASIYAKEGTFFSSLLKNYAAKNPGSSTLLQDNFIYNQNSFYVFDGISYKIDLSKNARYSQNGILLNSANKRITSLSYHGVEVTPDQKFILVTDTGMPPLSFLPKDVVDSVKKVRDYETGKNITMEYIKRIGAFGNISIKADNNWSLSAGKTYSFLLGVPKSIAPYLSSFAWNKGLAAETTSYSFFKGNLPSVTQTINIVAAQGRTEKNNEPVPVIVSASSKYKIKEIKYLKGLIKTAADTRWEKASIVNKDIFTVTANGIYTIKVTDQYNKSAITAITVDRYDPDLLPSPIIDPLTNRFSSFTGTAVPNAIIHAVIGSDHYSGTVKSDGRFSITIKPAEAFAPISVYLENVGKKSSVVTANVRKTGPDAVQINTIRVNDTCVTGTAAADTYVYALIWTTVYVGQGQSEVYKNSDFYNNKYRIVETDITMDPETGSYKIKLPILKTNMKVFVFSVDRFGATSKSTMLIPTY